MNRRRAFSSSMTPLLEAGKRVLESLPFTLSVLALFVGALAVVVAIHTQPLERVVIVGEIGELHRSALNEWLVDHVASDAARWDLDLTERKVESLTWIKKASATRLWPNAMKIEVVPHTPVALWGDGSFLNSEGQVFEPVPGSEALDLPKLSGDLNQQAELMDLYLRLSEMMPLDQDRRLNSITMDSLSDTKLFLDGGMVITLGRKAHLTRFQRFLSWYERFGTDVSDRAHFDLRYRNALAVNDPAASMALAANSDTGRGY